MGFRELGEVKFTLEEFLVVVLEIFEAEVNVVVLVQEEVLHFEVVEGDVLDFYVGGDGYVELTVWLVHGRGGR